METRKRNFDQRITFRMASSDRDRIFHRAKSEGISMTHLLRAIVTGYLNWQRKQEAV